MTTVPDYNLEPPPAHKYPCCPMCGTELYDYVIMDIAGEIVGCSECTRTLDCYEYEAVLIDEEY